MCEALSQKTCIMSNSGTNLGTDIQDNSTVAAHVLSSERECRMRDTVKRPRENARSTSVDVAVKMMINITRNESEHD